MKILYILEQSEEKHLSAEEIYKILLDQGEEIGLSTIYRVLTQFEASGLLVRHHFEEGRSVFELDSGEHHDHLVCIKCGKIEEFIDEVIERRQVDIAKNHGYSITDHSLYIYGTCSSC